MKSKEKAPDGREIESHYTTTITYTCPTRGKVTEIVKVAKYKAQQAPENKPVDFAISELFGSETADDLGEAGFHESND